MPCPQRRRIPSIIRAVSPCFTPPCIARRRRERSRPPMLPPTPCVATISPLTRPPIHPTQRKFPLPVRRAESVTVRRAMPADHHEALPSLLYLCGGLRPERFMWCLHSVSCRSFFLPHLPPLCLFYIHLPLKITLRIASSALRHKLVPLPSLIIDEIASNVIQTHAVI